MAVIPSFRNLRTVLQSVLFVPFATAFFFNMIPLFLTAWENASRLQDRFQDTFRGRENSYDFIIVGGGTAGSVLANRLSEYYTVLLLESGGPENPLQLVPALTMNFLNQPQTDWSYKTVPQRRACLNSISQQGSLSAGRALGGSSTLDYMAFMRGHPVDFDNWALITGDRGWSYAEVLPYFRRSEEFIGSTTDTSARGADGEMRIRTPDFQGLGREWIRAGEEIGYSNIDFNGRYTQGFGMLQYPVRRGMRQSTARAFIRPIRLGPRLRVVNHALVSRILFRDMSNMAYGVEYERFGRNELAIASREVIISAGTIGSPKILMLSGIGPRQHLEETGIPVRVDLPVGRNLQDHLGVQLGPFYTSNLASYMQDRDITPENIIRWVVKARGPLTTTGLQAAATFSSTVAQSRGETNWPDILLLLQGQGIHRTYPETFARAYNIQEDQMINYYENAVGRDSFHIKVIGARPTSTGSVLLSSANPKDPMIINPRYLEDNGDGDIRILLEGIQTALRLVENTTSFRNIGAQFTEMKLPGCEAFDMRSGPYWECYIRRFTISQHNPIGTVSMGAVLDSNLKVRNTRGLRVIDASVMPTLPSVGTFASTMMIAEKGADNILREYGASQINRGIGDAVFGRNGVINRNPIQRFISREFDRINPLPSLFRPPPNRTVAQLADFNPFSRFLGIFGLGGRNSGDGPGSLLGLGTIFNLLNPLAGRNTGRNNNGLFSVFGNLFGNNRNNNGGTTQNNITPMGVLDQLFPQRNLTPNTTTNTPVRNIFANNNNNLFGNLFGNRNNNGNNGGIFEQLFPQRNQTPRTPSPVQNIFARNNNNSNSLFDILFPARNNGTGQVQSVFRNQHNNNMNIFGNLFAPRNDSVGVTPFSNLFNLEASPPAGGTTSTSGSTTSSSTSNSSGLSFMQQLFSSQQSASSTATKTDLPNLLTTMFGGGKQPEVPETKTQADLKTEIPSLLTTMLGVGGEEETNRTSRAVTSAISNNEARFREMQSAFNNTASRFGELLSLNLHNNNIDYS